MATSALLIAEQYLATHFAEREPEFVQKADGLTQVSQFELPEFGFRVTAVELFSEAGAKL